MGAVIHRTYILFYIGVSWWGGCGVEGGGNAKERTPPPPSKEAAELNAIWFLSLRSFAQQPNPDSRCSIPSSVCEHRNSASLLFFLPCQEFLGGECQ